MTVSWLLNFRIRNFLKSAVKGPLVVFPANCTLQISHVFSVCLCQKADLATERERQLTTARANQLTGLSKQNMRARAWKLLCTMTGSEEGGGGKREIRTLPSTCNLSREQRLSRAFAYFFSLTLGTLLPSPCTASSQAFSVNVFRWRIRDERLGHSLGNKETCSENVTRNAWAVQNNESTQGLVEVN